MNKNSAKQIGTTIELQLYVDNMNSLQEISENLSSILKRLRKLPFIMINGNEIQITANKDEFIEIMDIIVQALNKGNLIVLSTPTEGLWKAKICEQHT